MPWKRNRPELLRPCKALLLELVAASEQQEVRWNVAQLLPRPELDERERAVAVDLLKTYLVDKSRIVRTNAMQGLDLAQQDDRLRPEVVALTRNATATGSPAMQARRRKLLAVLREED